MNFLTDFLTDFFDGFFDGFFWQIFLTNFDEFLTIASFRIAVPTILL